MNDKYDALILVSFGGPEGREDVIPFLENVLLGKNVPRERMLEVAEHYYHFDGVSPINQQCRELIDALRGELKQHGPDLPIYWGNRNWHPFLADTLRQMRDDGIKRVLAFFTSTFSSYSGCRQYRENIAAAREEVGPGVPEIDKLRFGFNHPGFIDAMADRVQTALDEIPPERHENVRLVYTAHSIPIAMSTGCEYVKQLNESCRLITEQIGRDSFDLVYQSRSGPPHQPWLEPDICDHLKNLGNRRGLAHVAESSEQNVPVPLSSEGFRIGSKSLHESAKVTDVVVIPIGFISDHMEVLFDLDTEAKQLCEEIGLNMIRAATVGTHPRFITMIRELIEERLTDTPSRQALGTLGPCHDICPEDCCPSGRR